jgi:hypothetical protein
LKPNPFSAADRFAEGSSLAALKSVWKPKAGVDAHRVGE